MLTVKQNLLETIHGGNPDRYVNSYDPFVILLNDPIIQSIGGLPFTMKPGEEVINGWGVTVIWPEGTPGSLPLHNDEVTLLKDVTKWKEVVKAPNVVFSEEEWAAAKASADAVDRNERFVTGFIVPGIFEKLHYLMGMEETMINFYEEPEAMHELIDFLTDWEIKCVDEMIKHIQPEAIFHHDDWGTQHSLMMSPDMFAEFIVPAYKKVYGYIKEKGLLIMHHSDSYAKELVPYMIEIGIDIWQGALSTNNIPEMIEKYGGQITFMGGIDNGKIDREDWTQEKIAAEVEKACKENGTKYYIPGTTVGGADSAYLGVYEAVGEEIDKMSKIMFK